MRPKCQLCNTNLAIKYKSGNFGKKCKSCMGRRDSRFAYRSLKKDQCENELCPLRGSVYEQYILDVDHADGDRSNNDPANLITLCCVCHRRKTHNARDFLNIKNRELV